MNAEKKKIDEEKNFAYYKSIFMLSLDGCGKNPCIFKSMDDLVKFRKEFYYSYLDDIEDEDLSEHNFVDYADGDLITTAIVDVRKPLYAYISVRDPYIYETKVFKSVIGNKPGKYIKVEPFYYNDIVEGGLGIDLDYDSDYGNHR
ncbi:MAG: hypothetical protein Harvfovirus3_20 [Harvfovirus sp.]|uniref:Uncharacterized protein n=1 Tax=Harvfovirus sp. TaxID=2487768 RepID=A0A3G5A067_9VIRU|nr:MAG: hypothetical protein Harvfovirus3_20 [Harvfovirus sp.]